MTSEKFNASFKEVNTKNNPTEEPKRKHEAPARSRTLSHVIPGCFEECSEEDHTLLDMRDKQKLDWAAIRVKWENWTGDTVAPSTLRNRYRRLKDYFAYVAFPDLIRLLESKWEAEDHFEAVKWQIIANGIVDRGGEKYEPITLLRRYQKVMKDTDFETDEGSDLQVDVKPGDDEAVDEKTGDNEP